MNEKKPTSTAPFVWPLCPFTEKTITTQQKRELLSLRARSIDFEKVEDEIRFRLEMVARMFGKRKGDLPPPLEEMVQVALHDRQASVRKHTTSLLGLDVVRSDSPLVRRVWTANRVERILSDPDSSVAIAAIKSLHPLFSATNLSTILFHENPDVVAFTWGQFKPNSPLSRLFESLPAETTRQALIRLLNQPFEIHDGSVRPSSLFLFREAIRLCETKGLLSHDFIFQTPNVIDNSEFMACFSAYSTQPLSSHVADALLKSSCDFSLPRYQQAIPDNHRFFIPLLDRLLDTPDQFMALSWCKSCRFPDREFSSYFQRFEASWLQKHAGLGQPHERASRLAL
jgi:hypothetical protein